MACSGIKVEKGVVRGNASPHLEPSRIGGYGIDHGIMVARPKGDHMAPGQVVLFIDLCNSREDPMLSKLVTGAFPP